MHQTTMLLVRLSSTRDYVVHAHLLRIDLPVIYQCPKDLPRIVRERMNIHIINLVVLHSYTVLI